MNFSDIGSAKIAYELYGGSERTIVIDTCLGGCSAEWRHIAKALSSEYRVLLYDRVGYGESSVSTLERTPENIGQELNKLLNNLGINKDIVIVGHSQGGLYSVMYSIMYPQNVKGLVLLDPATPYDNEFKEKLTEVEYKNSGVDKTKSFKAAIMLTSLGLGFILKPLLKKGPPFYYHDFSSNEKEYILNSLTKKSTYETAIAEYNGTHSTEDTKVIMDAVNSSALKGIPVKLITHSSDFYIKELEYYGNMDNETAQKIENLWQDIMKKLIKLSDRAEHIIAPNSGHYIHLTDYEVLKGAIEKIFVII